MIFFVVTIASCYTACKVFPLINNIVRLLFKFETVDNIVQEQNKSIKILMNGERQIRRRIKGGQKTEDGYVRRRTSEAILCDVYKEPTIDMVMKSRRLGLLGHMEGMIEEKTIKKLAGRVPN